MRSSPKEEHLQALEDEFSALLIRCLKECANGRWGLFGQNQHPDSIRALHWPEAAKLRALAEEISALRDEFGQPSPECERFLGHCRERGENLPGEPKRAKKFLQILGFDW